MNKSTLKTQITGHIATLSVDRPKFGNSVNFQLMDELDQQLSTLEKNEEIRVVILTGVDKFFISGGDLKEFHQITSEEASREMSGRMLSILERIEEAPFFTIAAINGLAYGGGWEIALAFDFIFAGSRAKIGFIQGRFYLPPGWGGLTRLAEKVGKSKALELLATRKILTAEEALQVQFINGIFEQNEFEEKVLDFAKELSFNDRRFIAALKQGAQSISANDRKKNIASETDRFAKFWADEKHFELVGKFMKEKFGK